MEAWAIFIVTLIAVVIVSLLLGVLMAFGAGEPALFIWVVCMGFLVIGSFGVAGNTGAPAWMPLVIIGAFTVLPFVFAILTLYLTEGESTDDSDYYGEVVD